MGIQRSGSKRIQIRWWISVSNRCNSRHRILDEHTGARTYNTGDEWPAGGINIVPHTPLAGASGWNLFGGYELSVTAANVTTNPPGLQNGPIYRYSGGYSVATTIDPGYGYWIKLNSAGQIIIPETMSKGEAVEYFPEEWGRIILTDATGINYTLYAVKGETDLTQYELPPAPPAGMFDIRYSSGRIAEDINSSVKTIDMSGVTYPLTLRVERMDISLMHKTGKAVNVNLKSGEDVVISEESVMKLMVSGELIPAKYALEQNYPNPFNPSTVIDFSLPEDVANVKLSIYNTLGEKVAELVNTALAAGKYHYQWNAQNAATGMYIYELRTDNFISVKKMLFLK
ncbi:MAG: T9SS type A sorting domain-containing protein [Ignavibacteriaceae bacterium]|nr:T9SS type A sorting domain-containing protein [Ignavibacteriaceae bacterium]